MRVWHWLGLVLIGLIIVFAALWLARARIAAQITEAYFRSHGVTATVTVGQLGFSGAAGHFALGPADAPVLSAERIELVFDPLRLVPYVTEIRLVHPVVRAEIARDGSLRLGALQTWIDQLSTGPSGSRYVSETVKLALTGLQAFVATPAGPLEVDGDAQLVKSRPQHLSLSLRPALLSYDGADLALRRASVDYDALTAHLTLHADGDVRMAGFRAERTAIAIEADGLAWTTQGEVTVRRAHLVGSADLFAAGAGIAGTGLDMTVSNLDAARDGKAWRLAADIKGKASGQPRLKLPALGDARWDASLRRNLPALDANFAAHLERKDGRFSLRLLAPFAVQGGAGARLRLDRLDIAASDDETSGAAALSLSGGGLPRVSLSLPDWRMKDGAVAGHAAAAAQFDYAMLRGAKLDARGAFAWQNGTLHFTPAPCAGFTLAAFHPGASDLARRVRADLCGALSIKGARWTLAGALRNGAADLPLPQAAIAQASAKLAFAGTGGLFSGSLSEIFGTLEDRALPIRFEPLTGKGEVALAGRVWRGRLQMEKTGHGLGAVTFTHRLADASGEAHIDAPHLSFAPGALQPADLSPLLAMLRQAKGEAQFIGDLHWTPAKIDSEGKLTTANFDFLSPLGAAHGVKAAIAFSSLLPPRMPPGQAITISRIDWTLPFSAIDFRLGYDGALVKLDKLDLDAAEGHVSLSPLAIDLAHPQNIQGAATLRAISLNSLIAASNLQGKIQLEGKISGLIPFS
jgi:hypothetical protein